MRFFFRLFNSSVFEEAINHLAFSAIEQHVPRPKLFSRIIRLYNRYGH